MIECGIEELNTFFTIRYRNKVGTAIMIYGEDASGKTTFVMRTVEKSNLPSVVIYTEGDPAILLMKFDRIKNKLYTAKDFEAQGDLLDWLSPKPGSLLVIDSISKLYAKALAEGENPFYLNRELYRQLALILSLTRRRNLLTMVVNQIRVGRGYDGLFIERPVGGVGTFKFFDVVLRFSRYRKRLTHITVEKGNIHLPRKTYFITGKNP